MRSPLFYGKGNGFYFGTVYIAVLFLCEESGNVQPDKSQIKQCDQKRSFVYVVAAFYDTFQPKRTAKQSAPKCGHGEKIDTVPKNKGKAC